MVGWRVCHLLLTHMQAHSTYTLGLQNSNSNSPLKDCVQQQMCVLRLIVPHNTTIQRRGRLARSIDADAHIITAHNTPSKST